MLQLELGKVKFYLKLDFVKIEFQMRLFNGKVNKYPKNIGLRNIFRKIL